MSDGKGTFIGWQLHKRTPLTFRDVPDFGSGSGKSGIRPFFGNPAKSGSGQNFDRIWPDLGQASCMVIFLTTANSTGIFYLCE